MALMSRDFDAERARLVEDLKRSGYISIPEVVRAMGTVQRHLFMPPGSERAGYHDRPQQIGHGQTISAPHMVGIMVEKGLFAPGQRALEVGGGCGYHAAVVAEVVGEEGHVYSVEVIPELVALAERNIERAGYSDRVTMVLGDGSKGHPQEAPYDRIWVAAASPGIPETLVEQLADPGILLIPVGTRMYQNLIILEKENGQIRRSDGGGCVFVPLVGLHGF